MSEKGTSEKPRAPDFIRKMFRIFLFGGVIFLAIGGILSSSQGFSISLRNLPFLFVVSGGLWLYGAIFLLVIFRKKGARL
ncbi:MAG: hypothetical protein HYY67_07400 [Thaumarchaeota archaeon]|nr:hypothetical protein [Nitrososphaerota archaeon]